MRIVEAKVSHPINAMGGLYILIAGTHEEIYKGDAHRLAVEIADGNGWKGDGKATVGIPSREGVFEYTRAYWFHERT